MTANMSSIGLLTDNVSSNEKGQSVTQIREWTIHIFADPIWFDADSIPIQFTVGLLDM